MRSEQEFSAKCDRSPSRRVLAYHEFADWSSQDIYQLTPQIFRSHVVLAQRLAWDEAVHSEFTFDDAHISQIEIAASILEEANMRGCFFAPAAWIGNKSQTADWHDLRALLQAGHRVGSHGNTHVLLTRCSAAQLANELHYSRLTLEDKLGSAITAISLPGGRCNAEVIAQCASAGYEEVYTSQPTLAPLEPDCSTTTVKLIGRLAVLRKMKIGTIASYLRGDPLTVAALIGGFHIRKTIRQVLGDDRYQKVWRRMLRAPMNRL